MKNIGMIVGVVAILALSACNPKGRSDEPTPKPSPKPTPNSTVLVVREISGGELIIENNLVSWEETQGKAIVDMYATLKGDEKPTTFQVERGLAKWLFRGKTDLAKLGNAEKIVAYLSASETGNNQFQVTSSDYTFTTGAKASEVGNFTVSHLYTDALIGEASPSQGNLKMELRSPFRQVRLILKNSAWKQAVSNISVRIEGALSEAHYSNGTWSGTPTPLVVTYKDKETTWAGHEADTLLLAFPVQTKQVSATITYTTASGSKTETITTEELELAFTFATQEIENPSELVFTPMADTDYWVKANQDAFNLITSNYGGALTEAQLIKRDDPVHTWVLCRPLVDEVMHSKQLYKDDFNVIGWVIEMRSNWRSEQPDWGFAYGLETLDGKLVEVYPPLYSYASGGQNELRGDMTKFCYTSAPAGKYRLVAFITYPEWYSPENAGKWFKLPMLDILTHQETNMGQLKEYRKRHMEPIPMEKSPYKDMDIIEVIDRKAQKNVAPRWYMGYLYGSHEDYKKHNYLNRDAESTWNHKYNVGGVLGITTVNTSNQNLRGTIVAKAEYLPMFNPVGYWRLEQTGNHAGMKYHKNGWRTYITDWSHEVGRREVSLLPNSEQKIGIEIKQVDARWNIEGENGIAKLGPYSFIHFYWVDEFGNETMMMSVDYPSFERMEQENFESKHVYIDADRLFSQGLKERPEARATTLSNGFLFIQ